RLRGGERPPSPGRRRPRERQRYPERAPRNLDQDNRPLRRPGAGGNLPRSERHPAPARRRGSPRGVGHPPGPLPAPAALARLRSRSTEPLTLVTEPSADETQREVGRRAEADALCKALSELPPQQRDAIVLREFYGLSYTEVAAALGLTGPAVESLLFRSRRSL